MERTRVVFRKFEGGTYCTIYAQFKLCTIGQIDPHHPHEAPIPVVHLYYPLERLDILSRLFAKVTDHQISIQIYSGNAETDPVRFTVFIGLPDPSSSQVRDILGPEYANEIDPWVTWAAITARAEIACPRDMQERFIQNFKRNHTAHIYVHEDTEEPTIGNYPVDKLHPVHVFKTASLHERDFYE